MTLELTEMFIQVVGTSPVIQALAGGIIIALMNLFGASLISRLADPSEQAPQWSAWIRGRCNARSSLYQPS